MKLCVNICSLNKCAEYKPEQGNVIIKFRPTHEIPWFKQFGLSTLDGIYWEVSRSQAAQLIKFLPDNFRLVKSIEY